MPRKRPRSPGGSRCHQCGHVYSVKRSTAYNAPSVFCRRACELRWITAEVERQIRDDQKHEDARADLGAAHRALGEQAAPPRGEPAPLEGAPRPAPRHDCLAPRHAADGAECLGEGAGVNEPPPRNTRHRGVTRRAVPGRELCLYGGAMTWSERVQQSKANEYDGLVAENARLRAELAVAHAALADYDAAADKFIAKVETGRAHSRETYADLKAARAR
jgi:hypothetical protein